MEFVKRDLSSEEKVGIFRKKVNKPLDQLEEGEYIDILEDSPVSLEAERRRKMSQMTPQDRVKEMFYWVQDFPKQGVNFLDLTPLFEDSTAFNTCVTLLMMAKKSSEYILSPEARGFIIGGALASVSGIGFILARKEGKLPQETYKIKSTKEYGEDVLCINKSIIDKVKTLDERVIIVDDILATGGTAISLVKFLTEQGIRVSQFLCVAELSYLNGREAIMKASKELNLLDFRVDTLITV